MNYFVIFNSLSSLFNLHRHSISVKKRRKITTAHLHKLILMRKLIRLKVRNAPRQWRFQRESTFFSDVSSWPNDIFRRLFRIGRCLFNEISATLNPILVKQNLLRQSIPVQIRVAVSLYTLKSGADYSVVGDVFGISKSSVCRILEEFMDAFVITYGENCISFPRTLAEQEIISERFLMSHQFPNCVGAVDGCHIPIITPADFGSDYYNYKNWHSVVLQALVDSDYQFLNIYAGQPGKVSDGGVFQASELGSHLYDLVHERFHIIADSAYPISSRLLKPFAGDNLAETESHFNYRLSRARMVVESAFGKLKGRWRILLKRLDWEIPKVIKCIHTCCILHNIVERRGEYFNPDWLNDVEEFDAIYPQPDNIDVFPGEPLAKIDGEIKRYELSLQLENEYAL